MFSTVIIILGLMDYMNVPKKDIEILRELGKKIAEISTMPVQQEKINLWKRLNSLKKVKPMIWIDEIPWHEMDVHNELVLRCTTEFCRQYEIELRRLIYRWRHMRTDMVIEPFVYSKLAISDTGFGFDKKFDMLKTDSTSNIMSRQFHSQINTEEDIEKIQMPEVTHNVQKSERNYELTKYIFDGILNVEKRGIAKMWFAPWDTLVCWWSVMQLFVDLYERPQMVHKAIDRLVNAYLYRLDQYENMGLLSLNNKYIKIGSGGPGFTDELPGNEFDDKHVRTKDMWSGGAAQIFSDISPAMHEEFAINYEKRWMKRFGLAYYGCCEPLHKKINILEKIHNLRKISMSRWVDVDEGVENIKDRYVFSYKPNPAVFAKNKWDVSEAREELERVLEKTTKKGCIVEIIMKDISTVRYEPWRLWEWAETAEETVRKFKG